MGNSRETMRPSCLGVLQIVTINVGPFQDSPARSNLPKRIVEKLQLDDLEAMLIVQLLDLPLDVLAKFRWQLSYLTLVGFQETAASGSNSKQI